MDSNNWQVQIRNQVIGTEAVAAGGMGGADWRTELYPDGRLGIVLKIMEILKRHLPCTGQEGLQETALRFEEEIYTTATSQSDYLRMISLKMLAVETKSQDPMASSYQSSAPSDSENPQYPAERMEYGYWRTQLQPDARQRMINNIMETLKRHLPFAGQEGLQELNKIAVRFEEKIYAAATSQTDYVRKISLKMLTMETKSQNPDHRLAENISGIDALAL